MAQGYNNSSGINDAERKRLENQFKELKTFYIDDDGLVVYQSGSGSSVAGQNQETDNSDYIQPETSPVYNQEEQSNNQYLIEDDYQPTHTSVSNANGVVSFSKKAVNPTNSISLSEDVAATSDIVSPEKEDAATKITAIPEKKDDKPTAPAEKKSIFDKNKQKARQYKSLEEAALAAQALLDNLKKEQAQGGHSKSMSSRLAQGAKSTLRKKPLSSASPYDPYSSYEEQSTPAKQTTISSVSDEYISEFGDEPTYYINGQEVDKIEITKLRKKDIVSKEVRVRNTLSNNPNGEVWYEVRQ